jgi:hypothetical protein
MKITNGSFPAKAHEQNGAKQGRDVSALWQAPSLAISSEGILSSQKSFILYLMLASAVFTLSF